MSFLANKTAFDVLFEIDAADGTRKAIGLEVKYHEHASAARAPATDRLKRYVEVTERSGAFRKDWRQSLIGTRVQQIWLDHLLLLSMLQHPSRRWQSGLFVLVYPVQNASFRIAAEDYARTLRDRSTFEARTLQSLVDDHRDENVRAALRSRYLRDG